MDAGQSGHPRQRHLRLRLRICRAATTSTASAPSPSRERPASRASATPRRASRSAPRGMLNAVGPAEPRRGHGDRRGAARSCSQCFHKPVIANVSGFSVEEYADICAEAGQSRSRSGWLEVNISCPNVHGGGMSFGTDPEAAAERHPGGEGGHEQAGLSSSSRPNVTDIAAIATRLRGRRAPTASASSTPCWACASICARSKPAAGQHNGRPLRPRRSSRWRCAWSSRSTRRSTSPSSAWAASPRAEDVIEMMLAGATAVEVGAANLVDPYRLQKYRRGPARGHGAIRHTRS